VSGRCEGGKAKFDVVVGLLVVVMERGRLYGADG
jgi:hypothetical protein